MHICKMEDCVGCAVCMNRCPNSCINMEKDNEGFEYPVINKDQCCGCNSCIKICPVNARQKLYTSSLKVLENSFVYAAKNNNSNMRKHSSSGGIFSLFAQNIINKKGIIVGAGFDENYHVKHYIVDSIYYLDKIIGSKYMQSFCGDVFLPIEKYLKQKRWVLFSGTPCQVAGLKSFLGKEYERLICIDVICHGVPSQAVWDTYLDSVGIKKEEIQAVSFRDKVTGWKNYSITIKCKGEKKISQIWNQNSYMIGFVNDLYLRKSCYDCKFKGDYAVSDITLGDFWGLNVIDPEFDDDRGTTIMRVRTEKGQRLLNEIIDGIQMKEFSYREAVSYNPSAEYSSNCYHNRKLFYENWDKEQFGALVDKIIGGEILS